MTVAFNGDVDLTLEIGFDSDPTDSIANTIWTDVTDELRAWSVERGKQHQLDRFEAGIGQFVLDNRSGDYDPTNESGAFFPNVRIDRRIRLRATNVRGIGDFPGGLGDNTSTPDNSDLDITGDIDLRVALIAQEYAPASDDYILSKWNTNQKSYALVIGSDASLTLRWSVNGTTELFASSTQLLTDIQFGGQRLWLRATLDVDNGASSHDVNFYYGGDGVTWEQLGDPNVQSGTPGVTSMFAGTANLLLSGQQASTGSEFEGQIIYAEVRNGINGVMVANPDFRFVALAAPSFVDSTGKTWTMNGNTDVILYNYIGGPEPGSPNIVSLHNGFIKTYRQGYVTKMAGEGDAVTVIESVDGFNILATTELPDSVWAFEIQTDIDGFAIEPVLWYRLGDSVDSNLAVNSGKGGSQFDGEYLGADGGPGRDEDSLVFLSDQPSSLFTQRSNNSDRVSISKIITGYPFTIEFFMRVEPEVFGGMELHLNTFVAGVSTTTDFPQATGVFVYLDRDDISNLYMKVDDGTNIRIVSGSRTLDDGMIHHIACRFNSATDFRMWIDGTEDSTSTSTGGNGQPAVLSAGIEWFIGPIFDTAAPGQPYVIDEVVIWFAALTPATILRHALGGVDNAGGQRLNAAWGDERPHTRIGHILDWARWPTADRVLEFDGSTILQSTSLGDTALEYCQLVETTAFGSFYQKADGRIKFEARDTLFTQFRNRVVQATFGDGMSEGSKELGYVVLASPTLDDTQIVNDATVGRDRGPVRRSENEVSIEGHYRQRFVATDLLHNSELQSENYADFITANFGEPVERIEMLEVNIHTDMATVRDRILDRRIHDRVKVVRRPPGGQIKEQEAFIMSIKHSSTASPKEWVTEYQLTPVGDLIDQFWLMEIVGRSEIGETTVVGF